MLKGVGVADRSGAVLMGMSIGVLFGLIVTGFARMIGLKFFSISR